MTNMKGALAQFSKILIFPVTTCAFRHMILKTCQQKSDLQAQNPPEKKTQVQLLLKLKLNLKEKLIVR